MILALLVACVTIYSKWPEKLKISYYGVCNSCVPRVSSYDIKLNCTKFSCSTADWNYYNSEFVSGNTDVYLVIRFSRYKFIILVLGYVMIFVDKFLGTIYTGKSFPQTSWCQLSYNIIMYLICKSKWLFKIIF